MLKIVKSIKLNGLLLILVHLLFGALTLTSSSYGSPKAYAAGEPGKCYVSRGYGVLEKITSAYGYTNGGCPSGFTPDAAKCYSYSEGVAPTEYSCDSVQECMSTQGSGYATTTFIPSSVDCEQFKLAARGESQEDANERIDSLNVSDQALETASNSLHTADYNTSTTLTNVATIVVKIIGALAGIAIVGSLVVAGAQYATAGDNSGAITKAKTRIAYTLIALVIYIMVYYVAVWLIPS